MEKYQIEMLLSYMTVNLSICHSCLSYCLFMIVILYCKHIGANTNVYQIYFGNNSVLYCCV